MWYENPLFLTPITLILGALGAYALTWINSHKQDVEREQQKENLAAQLEILRIQAEIDKQERINALAKQEQQTLALTALAAKQDLMAEVMDETHKLSNSSKTKMEAIEQDLRNQVKASDVAAHHAAEVSTTALQNMKDLAAAELRNKDQQIADLQRQVTTLALALPATAPELVLPTVAKPETTSLLPDTMKKESAS